MIKFKEIRLFPSEFYLDIYILSNCDKDNGLKHFIKRYGEDEENYNDLFHGLSLVTDISSTKKSELKGHRRIVLILYSTNRKEIIHEIIHVIWRCHYIFKVEMDEESQEWQALMAEYLFDEITKWKDYKKI